MASIRERARQDGQRYWSVLFRHGGVQASKSFRSRREAVAFRKLVDALGPDAALGRTARPEADVQTVTVAELLELHIDGLHSVTPRTRADYRRDAERHITPHLGDVPIDEVNPARAAAWTADRSRQVSDKTLRQLHGLLSAALSTAVRQRLLEHNPIRGMTLPRRTEHLRPEVMFLTPAQFQLILLEHAQHWRPLLATLAGTGLRWGEAIALDVVDVDRDPWQLRITKSVRRTDDGYEIGPPKSARARRTVSLPDNVVHQLQPLLARAGDQPLFSTTRGGGRLHHRTFPARTWTPAIARAMDRDRHPTDALPRRPRIHDLRHTHAAWLIAAGIPLPVIQRRLGHESITTTIDTYGHLAPELHQAAADAADRALNPGQAQPGLRVVR